MAERVEGLKELSRKLEALGERAGGKALRNATAAAMRPVRKEAKASAPVGVVPHKTYKGRQVFPGFLKRSVILRTRLSRDRKTAYAHVGVKAEAFYGVQFVERGTSRFPRRPWLEPTFRRSQSIVLDTLKEKLKYQIDKARK
jgi:HK97 gp10 family phage protein